MVLDSSVERDLERAAHRAFVRNISAKLVDMARAGHDGTEFYDVASFAERGSFHRVRLDFTADGIDAACDCIAGQNGKICQHIAAALEASQSMPYERAYESLPVQTRETALSYAPNTVYRDEEHTNLPGVETVPSPGASLGAASLRRFFCEGVL